MLEWAEGPVLALVDRLERELVDGRVLVWAPDEAPERGVDEVLEWVDGLVRE